MHVHLMLADHQSLMALIASVRDRGGPLDRLDALTDYRCAPNRRPKLAMDSGSFASQAYIC